ncbi:polymer-forming cytoskeletal protein [Paenibacillus radicis (ex Gao et al. 2016)]|uniref:Polymer-forming cytoskeletal protein n=1 Tax=Paenibacillus radicis (ex Gao et al. 2016) TaxID=1737354 RepID=A0A917H4C3_9BACL|nr:polymer-forming cytoskeletal protein [Paenibacillus radicis (ex Gao et al. 2016)]GGG67152.1 hypothetical protein GCM10010918_22180 [Paenibacillus radicis (ex Gao et al. 2016)]
MVEETVRHLLISGIGALKGGIFQEAKIEGVGDVDGDVVCTNFKLDGKVKVDGSVSAQKVEMNGVAFITGSLRSDSMSVQGKLEVKGDLIGEDLQLNAKLIVKGRCETESLRANGSLRMGMLNAGSVHIELNGTSHIAEIGGGHIHIQKQSAVSLNKWLKAPEIPPVSKLTAQMIEGDDIYLEYTTAAVVRGTNIIIGPGCKIGLVEYKAKFDQDKKAKVERAERI